MFGEGGGEGGGEKPRRYVEMKNRRKVEWLEGVLSFVEGEQAYPWGTPRVVSVKRVGIGPKTS